jgi:hypothetical protein
MHLAEHAAIGAPLLAPEFKKSALVCGSQLPSAVAAGSAARNTVT